MATIYDYVEGYTLADGLQGSDVCDEAILAAKRRADDRGSAVVLADDDGYWIVYPARGDGSRKITNAGPGWWSDDDDTSEQDD